MKIQNFRLHGYFSFKNDDNIGDDNLAKMIAIAMMMIMTMKSYQTRLTSNVLSEMQNCIHRLSANFHTHN